MSQSSLIIVPVVLLLLVQGSQAKFYRSLSPPQNGSATADSAGAVNASGSDNDVNLDKAHADFNLHHKHIPKADNVTTDEANDTSSFKGAAKHHKAAKKRSMLPTTNAAVDQPAGDQEDTDTEKIANGVFDEWKKADPENVKSDDFVLKYGYYNLWLVAERLSGGNPDNPPATASRGGIVSTLEFKNFTWKHKPFDRLEKEGEYYQEVFSLGGLLFSLTFSNNNQSKIAYHKLFSWDDEAGHWQEIPLTIDPATLAALSLKGTHQALVVSVPPEFSEDGFPTGRNGKEAYVAVSNHGEDATPGTEVVFSKLVVDWNAKTANLKHVARAESKRNYGVVYTAKHDNQLVGFILESGSDGYHTADFVQTVDLKTNAVGTIPLTGLPYNLEQGRIYQVSRNDVNVFGGSRFIQGKREKVNEIWEVDLSVGMASDGSQWIDKDSKLKWENSNVTLPSYLSDKMDCDILAGIISADLKKGVFLTSL